MERTNITDEDEGKKVMDADGEEIGMVSSVRGGTAYVDPNPGIGDSLMAKLGWEDVEEDDYPLDESSVDQITEDGIHLRRDM